MSRNPQGMVHKKISGFKYATRRVNDLQVPRPNLETTRKSFSCEGAKVWNDIPNNMRNVGSAALYKKQVENYFWANEASKTP